MARICGTYDMCESYNSEDPINRCTLHNSCCKEETEGESCEDFVEIIIVDLTKLDEKNWERTHPSKLSYLRGQHYDPVFKDEVRGMF